MPENNNLWHQLWRMLLSNILESGSFYFISMNLHSFMYRQTSRHLFYQTKEWWLGDYTPDGVWKQRWCAASQGALVCTSTPWLPYWLTAVVKMIASLQPRGDPPVDGHRCHFIVRCSWDQFSYHFAIKARPSGHVLKVLRDATIVGELHILCLTYSKLHSCQMVFLVL